jgi:hypothetical protein
MTHDQWKTTDPNDTRYCDEDEREKSELEQVYDDLFAKSDELKFANERIARLEAENKKMVSALWECESYLEDHEDIVDGSYGVPEPNKAMTLLAEVREALGHNLRF